MAVNRQRHLLQLAYTDRLLGNLITRMEKTRLWDDALVIVTADHGKSFIPGSERRHLEEKPHNEAQFAWVPVFIKQPKQSAGVTTDANMEHVDLLPTVAESLGLPLTFKVDGISQLSSSRATTDKHFFNFPGHKITFDGPPAFKHVLRGVTDTFVNGVNGEAGLFQTGSRRDWIGKRVSSLASRGVDVDGRPSVMRAELAGGIDFASVDPSRGHVPALVFGTLSHSARRGEVLMAVNGTVAAVSRSWPEHGKPSFAGMVSDDLFRAGRNRLDLYEVAGGVNIQLRRIPVR
jgi:hypothetical protein